MNSISLYEIKGIISSCAIEDINNNKHEIALERLERLINDFGLFFKVDFNTIMRILYYDFKIS